MTLLLTRQLVGDQEVLATEGALSRFSELQVRQALKAHGNLRSQRQTKHRLGNSGTLVILSSPLSPPTLLTPAELRELEGKTKTFNPTREKRARPVPGGNPRRSIR